MEAAHRNAWRFPHGVTYAEAPCDPAIAAIAYLFSRLAGALGLAVAGDQEVAQALLDHAHATATLFVLDNLETLPKAELRRLADFLGRLAGRSAAIATLRPPLPLLEDIAHAASLPLQEGLRADAAVGYALALAHNKGLSLTPDGAGEIARAAAGHPLLITNIVAQARRHDRQALLAEVRRHEGDFAGQLEAVYAWSAARIREPGCRAWQALPLFPAGWAPEDPLRGLAGPAGTAALRDAAVADFDPRLQGWRWHPTAAEYAGRRWPLDEAGRGERLLQALPGWTAWLQRLRAEGAPATHARLEAVLPDLDPLLEAIGRDDDAGAGAHGHAPLQAAWDFLQALE